MKRGTVLTAASRTEDDDPRIRNEYGDGDVMNDQTKPETVSSQSADSSQKKAANSPPLERCDKKTPDGNPRMRTSEPYLTWLGQSLRQSYEETLSEPVPDGFRDLLTRLEQENQENEGKDNIS